jgi:hypothetical protein
MQAPEALACKLEASADPPQDAPKAAKEYFPAVPKPEAVAVAGWQEMYDVKDGAHAQVAFILNKKQYT